MNIAIKGDSIYCYTLINQGIAHLSLEMIPLEVDGNLQLDNVQEIRDSRTFSPKCDIPITTLCGRVLDLCGRGGGKMVRARGGGSHKEHCFPSKTGQMHI